MRVGAENRRAVILAGLLAIVAIYTMTRWLTTPEQQVASKSATPSPTPTTAKGKRPGKAVPQPIIASLDPTLRLDQLRVAEEVKYEGKGRNIFRAGSEPTPDGPIAKPPVANNTPKEPVIPPPPPINLKFYGFASKPGQPKQVFLSQGEDVFIAAEGDIVNRRYKVLRIGATSVEVEDLQYNNRQTLPLTQS